MKVHKITLYIVDFDNVGAEGAAETIENAHYPNRCISPRVIETVTKEVDWSDDHPLNKKDTVAAALENLFGK